MAGEPALVDAHGVQREVLRPVHTTVFVPMPVNPLPQALPRPLSVGVWVSDWIGTDDVQVIDSLSSDDSASAPTSA